MADVRLDFYDLDADELPDVCMKCAAPSVVRPVKTFQWVPYWARMIPFGVAFMKRRRVPIPLCERHKNYWTIRYAIGFGGLGLFLLLLIGGIALMAIDDGSGNAPTVLGGVCLAAAGVVFLVLLVALIVLSVTQIGVFEITDDSIVLTNVSPEFVQAYREMTRSQIDPGVENIVRESWRRPGERRPYASDEPRGRPPDLPPDDKYQRG